LRSGQLSALSPQPSALSPQPSANMTFINVIASVAKQSRAAHVALDCYKLRLRKLTAES
jgi:hypothetical protein